MSFGKLLESIYLKGYDHSLLRYIVRNKCPVSTRVQLLVSSYMGNSGYVRNRFAPRPC